MSYRPEHHGRLSFVDMIKLFKDVFLWIFLIRVKPVSLVLLAVKDLPDQM